MSDVSTGYEDVDRLMKMARRVEREGKKETAEIIYTAASEIARMRHPAMSEEKTDDLVKRLEAFAAGDWSSSTVNEICAEAARELRALSRRCEEVKQLVLDLDVDMIDVSLSLSDNPTANGAPRDEKTRRRAYPTDEWLRRAQAFVSEASPSPASEWQGIESAPKDAVVLVFGLWAGEITGPDEAPGIYVAQFSGKSDFDGFWWTVQSTDAYAAWVKATHWQPLPAPPLLSQDDREKEKS